MHFRLWPEINVSLGRALGSDTPPACRIWIGSIPFPLQKERPPEGGHSFWSRVRESNPPSRLGKPLYYRYTNPARLCKGIIAKQKGNFNLFLSIKSAIVGKNMVAKSKPPCYNTACVHVAQPFLCIGMSPSGKAPDFDSGISSVRIRPSQPNMTR